MKYKPVHTNLLVELIKEEQEDGQIIIPQEDIIVRALVKEIGDGNLPNGRTTPMLVHPLMYVWFDRTEAVKLPFIGDEIYLVDQDFILVIEED